MLLPETPPGMPGGAFKASSSACPTNRFSSAWSICVIVVRTDRATREQPLTMKYNHIGIPTTSTFDGEIPLPHLKVTVSDHQNNPFGIQWQRYWDGAPVPDLVKTVPHVAFEVDDLAEAIRNQKVIIDPNSPSAGVLVAFIEVNGAPVELMQIDHLLRKDL
jgi:hypothetical protein